MRAIFRKKYIINKFHLVVKKYIALCYKMYNSYAVERKLGETINRVSKHLSSFIKMKPNVVYDVPLLSPLLQQLCDNHIFRNRGHSMNSIEISYNL